MIGLGGVHLPCITRYRSLFHLSILWRRLLTLSSSLGSETYILHITAIATFVINTKRPKQYNDKATML